MPLVPANTQVAVATKPQTEQLGMLNKQRLTTAQVFEMGGCSTSFNWIGSLPYGYFGDGTDMFNNYTNYTQNTLRSREISSEDV